MQTQRVLDIDVAITTYDEVVELVLEAVQDERGLGVSPVAVHAVMESFDDPTIAETYQSVDIVPSDGHGVRHAVNFLARRKALADRVYGPDLMLRIAEALGPQGGSIYLYGSSEEVSQDLAVALVERFPGLEVAGRRSSRFRDATDEELAADIAEIRESGADVVFVGLGTPRQDVFIRQTVREIRRPMLGCGVGFDYHSGHMVEPPEWFRDHGLQWMYRLVQEPRRLWHRYLVLNPRFFAHVLRQRVRENAQVR